MSSDEEYESEGGEGAEIQQDEGPGIEEARPSKLSAFLAMVLSDERIDAVVAKKEEIFPRVWITERITSISLYPGKTAKRNFLVRNWSGEEPLAITGATGSLDGIRVLLAEGTTVALLGETKIEFEITPEGMEPGRFEAKIVLQTDCPGYETMTVRLSGKVYPPR